MILSRMLRLGLFGTGISLAMAAGYQPAAAQQTVSPAFGKLIIASEDALKKGQIAVATRDVNAAAELPGNTAYENSVVAQLRGAIASQSGDYGAAIASYTSQINAGGLSPAETMQRIAAITTDYFSEKNYAQAAVWADKYFRQGGSDPAFKPVQIQAHYYSGDYPTAARLEQAAINAKIKARQTPTEDEFNLLYSCALDEKDTDGATAVLKQMVIYYPKPEYWANLIGNVTNADGFDQDRLEYDAGLLQIATKSLTATADYMTLVQTALQGGHSGEALKLFDQATAAGLFGTGSPADVSREQRLRALILKTVDQDKAAEKTNLAAANTDGDEAATLGYDLVGLGQPDQGIALLEKAQSMDVKLPDVDKLRLAEAYVEVGRNDDAKKTFASVGGTTGTAGLAELWLLHLNQKA